MTPEQIEKMKAALEKIAREDYDPVDCGDGGMSWSAAAAEIAREALAAKEER